MQAPRFRWFILISLGIHTVILWFYVSILPFRPPPFSPLDQTYAEADLQIIPSSPRPDTSGPEKKAPGPRPSNAPLRGSSRVTPSPFRSSHNDGGIYPVIDPNVLYGIDKQMGISVPSTEVCVEGDQLRTKEHMVITEIKTDYSKCRYLELREDVLPKVICPPEAETRIVHFDHYASSPVVYSVRTCLEYDRSNPKPT